MLGSWAGTTLLLFLCSLAVSDGDLTGQLVDESKSLANVIGTTLPNIYYGRLWFGTRN
jgi:hypothetical protein